MAQKAYSIFRQAPHPNGGNHILFGRLFRATSRTVRTPFTVALVLPLLLLAAPYLQGIPTGQAVDEVLDALSRYARQELEADGEAVRFFSSDPSLELIPFSGATDQVESSLRTVDPSIGVEAVRVLRTGDEWHRPEHLEQLYAILTNVESMEGIEYYSQSRERMRTFFQESYRIAGPDSSERVPPDSATDPSLSDLSEGKHTFYAFQRDSSFGSNRYEVDVRRLGQQTLALTMTNLTRMYYGIFPAVSPERFRAEIIVTAANDGLVIYGTTAVGVISLFGSEERARDSFRNRINALLDWFESRIERIVTLQARVLCALTPPSVSLTPPSVC